MAKLRELADQYYAALLAKDIDAVAALHQPDCEFDGPDGPVRGLQTWLELERQDLEAMPPENVYEIVSTVESGDAIAVEVRWSGKTGAGRPFSQVLCQIFRVKDGLICSNHLYLDESELIEQFR